MQIISVAGDSNCIETNVHVARIKKMMISVVIPVYNVPGDLLSSCLNSVIKQTLRQNEYKIIIVDDCSSDERTLETIESFRSIADNIQVVRHADNQGLNEARHTGVKAAVGDYVVFVDGDDILTRDAIENLRMEAWKGKADLVTAPFFRWNNENKSYAELPILSVQFPSPYVDRLKSALSCRHSFTMCGRLFNRSVLTDEIFDLPPAQLHEDVTTFIRILFKVKKISHITRPIYYYTLNSTSITNEFTRKHAEGIFYSLNDWIVNAEHCGYSADLNESIPIGAEKLINTCVERCVTSEVLSNPEKDEVLGYIYDSYAALPIQQVKASLKYIKYLDNYEKGRKSLTEKERFESVHTAFITSKVNNSSAEKLLPYGIVPSDMAVRLKDKIVFVCQVDYQIRNAAAFAKELRLRGHPCVVLDNSAFASGGQRQLRPDEQGIFWRTEHIRVQKPPYGPDWLSTAKLVLTFNDYNDDFREALEYRHRLGMPSACVVEGINDFLREDFEGYRHLPYRRCDYVFLAGNNDKQYFTDRVTYVVGLPIIEKLYAREVRFPKKPYAILNVNFTYGVLESEREGFITKAKSAFDSLNLDWAITQHPMDKADLDGLPLSKSTQYELIDECTVFVSRFATGLLEALACGKPVIYFNPHNEKVGKFKDPLGAFEIARDEAELVRALLRIIDDIEAGIDFRKRALNFLEHHAGFHPSGPSVASAFAEAVESVLLRHNEESLYVSKLFFERLNKNDAFLREGRDLIFGDFDRHHKAQLNEEEMIGRYFGERGNIMVDVGANFGNSLDIYLGKGWTVHAFEPDPSNRKRLLDAWVTCDRLIVNDHAVSDSAGLKQPFFASKESSGISGLSAFTDNHRQVCEVTTTTLRVYFDERNLSHVDFLKVDVEGYDKFVLDGFPWDRDKPDVVLAEFEDKKTVPLGYSTDDLAAVLLREGYTVYVSEWLPIVRYGIAHDWRRLVKYSPGLDLARTWGNLIGFLEAPDENTLKSLVQQTIKFSIPVNDRASVVPAPKAKIAQIPKSGESAVPQRIELKRHFYADFGEWLKRKSPRIFYVMQKIRRKVFDMPYRRSGYIRALNNGFLSRIRERYPLLFRADRAIVWSLRSARRHAGVIIGLLAFVIMCTLLPIYPPLWPYRYVLWGAAVLGVATGYFAMLIMVTRAMLHHAHDTQNKSIADAIRVVKQASDQRSKTLENLIADIDKTLKKHQSDLNKASNARIDITTGEIESILDQRIKSASDALRTDIVATKREIATLQDVFTIEKKFSNYSNISKVRPHERNLSDSDVQYIRANWLRPLDLSLPVRQLHYIAHQICLAEERCEGRIATTIQAAMLRTLALLSLKAKRIELLEIGALFGIAAGALYRAGSRAQREIHLTLIDPLDGYYGKGLTDAQTGVPITRQTLINNLIALGIPDSHYRIIQHLSTDPEAHKMASDRQYDYVLLDGNHSHEGVANDFVLYGPLVKHGGLLIFDDYDTKDWPDIKPFVNENVRNNNDWLWIGGDWRTAVFRRRAGGAT